MRTMKKADRNHEYYANVKAAEERVALAHPTVVTRIRELEAEVERLTALVRVLLDNDPDDSVADGVTVLMQWRKEAAALVAGKETT